MGRLLATAAFAVFALGSAAGALDALQAAADEPTVRAFAVAGYSLLKLGVAAAFTVFVLVREPARRPAREPIAFAACAVAIGAVLVQRPPTESAATWLVLAGELITVLACAWMLVAALALGRCFGILPEARGLVTHGPYRFVRHPLYLGEFGACAGLVLAAPRPWNVAAGIAFAAAQAVRMRLEERALEREFPSYAVYAAGTPRLIPRLAGRRAH